MGPFSSKESYLGVDVGAGGIKLVELKKNKGRPQLWTYGLADIPLDIHAPKKNLVDRSLDSQASMPQSSIIGKSAVVNPVLDDSRIDAYGQILKDLLFRAKVTTKHATASLPVSQVTHAVITLPQVNEKEIDHHIRAKIQKILPRPIEEMQIVHQTIPQADGNKKNLRVLVTAAPLELITFYTAIFEKAGLNLSELETESFALERSLVGHDNSVVMVVDVGAEWTNFFIIEGGLPLTHRTIQIGGYSFDVMLQEIMQAPLDVVRQAKFDISNAEWNNDRWCDTFMPLIDPIRKEIQYSFDMFLHQSGNEGKRPEKIIITGGAALFPPVIKCLRESFSMKVFVGDPWARVVYQQDLRQILDSIGPRMSVSIGLALRNIV